MAIRQVITIQAAPGKSADFANAFRAVQAMATQDEGCEQYELFYSADTPERFVLLERWANQSLLDRNMEAERSRDPATINALMTLMAPGTSPQIARFETD